MELKVFIATTGATVVGGLLLALIVFFIKEKVSPVPNVNGRWYFQKKTKKTAYIPYRNMVLRYEVMLWREGTTVRGTAEKFYEDSKNGVREFVGVNRTRGKVEGYIQKNYLGKDRLFLHIIENGHGRESTTFHELQFYSKKMIGSFSSMVAKQSGVVTWQRTPF